MLPTICRTVLYRSKTGNYDLPAIVTATKSSLHMPGVLAGHIEDLDSDSHVHLHVMTPGEQTCYRESNVPHDPNTVHPEPGTWRWPPRV